MIRELTIKNYELEKRARVTRCLLSSMFYAVLLAGLGAFADSVIEIKPVLVDDSVIGYATFQSHNQKVVSHPKAGIFLSYLKTRNEAYTAQQWRLMRSADGGESFQVVYEDTSATNPPALEIDEAGNVYLLRMDFTTGEGFLYRFLAEKDYKEPEITTIPDAAAGKYCMLLDEPREMIYIFSHNNTFHTLSTDGTLKSSVTLIKDGPEAQLQYPHLAVSPVGDLHAAWTTVKIGEYLYWDIHHMMTRDCGSMWRNLDDAESLTLPIIADNHGPARHISGDDEFNVHTWLSSMAYNQGKLHFMYLAQMPTEPQREHYIRINAETGKEEKHLSPTFASDDAQIKGLDGFFCVEKSLHESDLFAIGGHQGILTVLHSPDNGDTWRKHAKAKDTHNLYAIGGSRYLSDDGYILGTFTDQKNGKDSSEAVSKVYFFKVKNEL